MPSAVKFMDGPSEAPKQATHYEVLGLTPALLDSQDDPSILIKQAYRRALLRHHPDKAAPNPLDQIGQAFSTLSSPRQRSEYDAHQRLSRATANTSDQIRFQTGVENVDLDDLEFDEDGDRWYRSCRCGNDRGYSFQEDDLVEVEHEGVLMVGCQDCSLWLKVHFAVMQEDEADTIETNKSAS
ncbi:Diphthamide biosynthesis protein 4 [Cladobotryum mycophilum]|uniref:Diphthamide biosynthesis protein 4 n=1 Tax=Cladobotryum mycophilum TaxID=491253 RepID=A0ABR0SDU2_9HYPO